MSSNQQCSVNECTDEAAPRIYDPVTRAEQKEKGAGVGYHGFTLNLCNGHAWDFAAWRHSSAREAMVEMQKEGLITQHTEGWTYVIRMNNGNIKIGKSKNPAQRFIRLSAKNNNNAPVYVLAVFKGGTSQELLTHDKWLHLRVKGRMEEFQAEPELLQWAESQGIPEELDLEEFYGWQERKHADPKRNKAEEWAEKLDATTRLTGELSKDPKADWSLEVKDETDWKF
ncbi:hypothetical protein YUYDRAFT_03345 [Streptomyces sp. ScaeMP-e48]|uniref:hypothetical protein n=1 Tax=Streptomyces sp. ScaeMP-e48 TaxID=1100823 RepID=UPI000823C0FC|nr:hypothetical protein [Streptomyces sp. ScaeMP-e48]SCK29886.1 hypothetical protein YUYDRAFT_03345 [Streptomyces sp. ScaeMP-e48]